MFFAVSLSPLKSSLEVCEAFLRALGASLPAEVLEDLLEQLHARGNLLHFNDFASVMDACIEANEALRGSQALLRACGFEKLPPKELAQRMQSHSQNASLSKKSQGLCNAMGEDEAPGRAFGASKSEFLTKCQSY